MPQRPEISIVLATRNRPAMLARALDHLCLKQITGRTYEVVVVDNGPETDGVAAVVARFPRTRLIRESRRGLSYARNAGICTALAPLIVFTDDDAIAPPHWLETITAPLKEHDAATGAIDPLQVIGHPERLFNAYGGHGVKGDAALIAPAWLRGLRWKLPLWEIGTTGNAAVRASVFRDPRVGLFDEALGAGSPVGSWEDLYFFYRLLRAGYTIERTASAGIAHEHRATMPDLIRQLTAYRRGEVAVCLILFYRHLDHRALFHLLVWIPFWRASLLVGELGRRIRRQHLFSFTVMARELLAYLGGPLSLFRSNARVRALGRTTLPPAADGHLLRPQS
jgi:O-antigen biosynthesis protein